MGSRKCMAGPLQDFVNELERGDKNAASAKGHPAHARERPARDPARQTFSDRSVAQYLDHGRNWFQRRPQLMVCWPWSRQQDAGLSPAF